jgi:hypothetical protein
MIYTNYYDTYDHRTLKTRLPVRSALFKQRTGGLVVRWVTTSEYPLLYVFLPRIRLLHALILPFFGNRMCGGAIFE